MSQQHVYVTDLAHEYFVNAIECLEKHNLFDKDIYGTDASYSRLYYLIGGSLMKQGKFEEAIEPLQNALLSSNLFPSLHVVLKKVLIECYKKIAEQDTSSGLNRVELCRNIVDLSSSLVLHTDTNSLLSNGTIKTLMNDAFSVKNLSSDRSIEWNEEEGKVQPFDFVLTFPEKSLAIEGDVVNAQLCIHSHLKTSVRLTDVLIESN